MGDVCVEVCVCGCFFGGVTDVQEGETEDIAEREMIARGRGWGGDNRVIMRLFSLLTNLTVIIVQASGGVEG